MKQTIEIEVPDGKKAVWNNGRIEFIPIDHIESIKTVKDAVEYLERNNLCENLIVEYSRTCAGSYSEKLCQYRIIVAALTNDEERKLTTGERWYPVVQFCLPEKIKNCLGKEIIGEIVHNGKRFIVVGGNAHNGAAAGLGYFGSSDGVSASWAPVGFRSVSSRKVAEHISKYFGKLLFEIHYGGCNCDWEWTCVNN